MTRAVMLVSGAVLTVCGVACLFVPEWLVGLLHLRDDALAVVPLAGAGAVGFGVLNWSGRAAAYGGIYGRPIVFGNVMYAGIMTLTLGNVQLDEPSTRRVGNHCGVCRVPGRVYAPAVPLTVRPAGEVTQV